MTRWGKAMGGMMSGLDGSAKSQTVGPAYAGLFERHVFRTGSFGRVNGAQSHGKGQQVDATMVGSILAVFKCAGDGNPGARTRARPVTRPRQSQTYPSRCADGTMLATICVAAKIWEGLCKSVEHPELIEDPRFNTRPNRRTNYDELNKTFAVFFKEQPRSVWGRAAPKPTTCRTRRFTI